jgi:hypothetical protein
MNKTPTSPSIPLDRFVGKSAFRVVDNILLSTTLRSVETLSISASKEPFDCFISTFKVRALIEHCGGKYPADAPSFISSFMRSFDESIEGTENLISILESNNSVTPISNNNTAAESIDQQQNNVVPNNNSYSKHQIKIRVTVVWTPKVATLCFANATSFDCTLVKVDPQAVTSFSWTLVNDMHSSLLALAKIANKAQSRQQIFHNNNKTKKQKEENDDD